MDGERALKPASAFRLQGAPTDYTFLLKLIEEVRIASTQAHSITQHSIMRPSRWPLLLTLTLVPP